ASAFQVRADNPLVGIEGRASLLRRLGARLRELRWRRLGMLYDRLAAAPTIEAAAVLRALLEALGPIWPGRVAWDGVPLGDTWPHPAVAGDALRGLVP